jgi:sec-independent protein translocase protein TatB
MFDIGWSELLLIGIVALIAIGPKELPGALRTLGQWITKVRRMASEFQNQFQDAIREAELADLKKEVDDMAAKASSFTHFDPIAEMGRDLEKSVGEFPSLDTPPVTPPPAATATDVVALPADAAVVSVPAAVTDTAAAPPPALPPVAAPAPEPMTPAADVTKPDAGRAA